jgi:hypothetical protein
MPHGRSDALRVPRHSAPNRRLPETAYRSSERLSGTAGRRSIALEYVPRSTGELEGESHMKPAEIACDIAYSLSPAASRA